MPTIYKGISELGGTMKEAGRAQKMSPKIRGDGFMKAAARSGANANVRVGNYMQIHPRRSLGIGVGTASTVGYGTVAWPARHAMASPNKRPGAASWGGYGSSGTAGMNPRSSGGYA